MDTSAHLIAQKLLIKHEGERLKPYRCTSGKLTIGVGINLDDRGITREESRYLLANAIEESIQDLSAYSYWRDLSATRRAVLIDLHHCVGVKGYSKFKKMHAALVLGDHDEAAAQIEDSIFAKQTGARADDLAALMRAG